MSKRNIVLITNEENKDPYPIGQIPENEWDWDKVQLYVADYYNLNRDDVWLDNRLAPGVDPRIFIEGPNGTWRDTVITVAKPPVIGEIDHRTNIYNKLVAEHRLDNLGHKEVVRALIADYPPRQDGFENELKKVLRKSDPTDAARFLQTLATEMLKYGADGVRNATKFMTEVSAMPGGAFESAVNLIMKGGAD